MISKPFSLVHSGHTGEVFIRDHERGRCDHRRPMKAASNGADYHNTMVDPKHALGYPVLPVRRLQYRVQSEGRLFW